MKWETIDTSESARCYRRSQRNALLLAGRPKLQTQNDNINTKLRILAAEQRAEEMWIEWFDVVLAIHPEQRAREIMADPDLMPVGIRKINKEIEDMKRELHL